MPDKLYCSDRNIILAEVGGECFELTKGKCLHCGRQALTLVSRSTFGETRQRCRCQSRASH